MNAILIAILAASPSVEVTVKPAGEASVTIVSPVETVTGKTGEKLKIKSGRHLLIVTRPGYWDSYANFTIKSGHKKLKVNQKKGVSGEEFDFSQGLGFIQQRGANWKHNQKNPWSASNGKITLSGTLPGTNAPAALYWKKTPNFLLSFYVTSSGSLSKLHLFGQTISTKTVGTHVRIVCIGNKEYMSTNGGTFKKAASVKNSIRTEYAKGASASVELSSIKFNELTDAEVKLLERNYGL